MNLLYVPSPYEGLEILSCSSGQAFGKLHDILLYSEDDLAKEVAIISAFAKYFERATLKDLPNLKYEE